MFSVLFFSAHRGPVTGCVYSKACNFLVTVGTDCDGRINLSTSYSLIFWDLFLRLLIALGIWWLGTPGGGGGTLTYV